MLKALSRYRFPIHPRREVVTMVLITGLIIVLFIGVTAVSALFHAQQDALAARWSARGGAELAAGRYGEAVNDYRASLQYAPDSYPIQLGMAKGLIGLGRSGSTPSEALALKEASAYLVNLWEAQPENGVVNRELARIAAGKGDTRSALRYYHNAVYAIWEGDAERERRETRWELVNYLLGIKAYAQAQSELIALAAEVGGDPGQQASLGQYFLKVQDNQRALAAFRLTLQADPHSQAALAGAGAAAFGMGDYVRAQDYLRGAVQASPSDRESGDLLDVAEQVTQLDPYRRQISVAERDRAVLGVIQTTEERLKSCPAAARSLVAASAPGTLNDAWTKLGLHAASHALPKNRDVVNQALNLAFVIERQAASQCGEGSSADAALVLISRLHEGS
jgi:tetratricopeptide (TPR) repeat protein